MIASGLGNPGVGLGIQNLNPEVSLGMQNLNPVNGQIVVIYYICNFIITILILHASTNIFENKAQAGWCSVQGQAFEEKMNNHHFRY